MTVTGASDAPLAGFIDHLRRQGFPVGVDRYARLLVLLEHVSPDTPPERLKTVVCPIFATTPGEQERFYHAFDTYFALLAPRGSHDRRVHDATSTPPELLHLPAAQRRSQHPIVVVVAAIVLLVVALVIALASRSHDRTVRSSGVNLPPAPVTPSPAANNPAPPTAVVSPPSPAVNPSTAVFPSTPAIALDRGDSRALRDWPQFVPFGVALFVFLGFCVAEWRIRARRKLIAEQRRVATTPLMWALRTNSNGAPYDGRADLTVAARSLRAREASTVVSLDVDRTVAATVDALGFPTFQYTRASRAPEYLLLIERASRRDHQAELFAELGEALEREGVHVTRYYFTLDPRVCELEDGHTVALADLRRRHPDHRLLVFGSGEGFTDPITGHLFGWVGQLLPWPVRFVFTPVPTAQWGLCELTLAQHFTVLPATVLALDTVVHNAGASFVDDIRGRWGGVVEDWTAPNSRDVVERLERDLGRDVLRWISACAVYPELHWDLTLALAGIPDLPAGLVTERNLLALARLPWFRTGNMPDDVRRALLDRIDPAVERSARTIVVDVLETSVPPAGSIAAIRHQLDLAVQKIALGRDDRARRAELQRALTRATKEELARDLTVIRLSEQSDRGRLALVLPERLRKLFFRSGIPSIGRATQLRYIGLFASFLLLVDTSAGLVRRFLETSRLATRARTMSAQLSGFTAPSSSIALPSLEVLQRLDSLRGRLDTLTELAQIQPSWSRQLLSARQLYDQARRDYFAAFDRLVFADTRAAMLAALRSLPQTRRTTEDYAAPYGVLKTYLITTAHPEKATAAFLVPQLMSIWLNGRSIDSARAVIGRRLFESYVGELRYGNPFPGVIDSTAVADARAFLGGFNMGEQAYVAARSQASETYRSVQFNRDVPGSVKFVFVPYEVPGAFTPDGATFMNVVTHSPTAYVRGEAWVIGSNLPQIDTLRLMSLIRLRYMANFVNEWRRFIESARVVSYASTQDAAEKLSALSDTSSSALLKLVRAVAQNTALQTYPEIGAAFQPFQVVARRTSLLQDSASVKITYWQNLSMLASMLNRASTGTVFAQAGNLLVVEAAAKKSVADIARSFTSSRDSNADSLLTNLLLAPIEQVTPMVSNLGAADINKRAHDLCGVARPILQKYPFAPNATAEASLAEVADLFAPRTGRLWRFYNEALSVVLPSRDNQYVATNGAIRLDSQFVAFVNRAKTFSDVLFKNGGTDPHLSITIVPLPPRQFTEVAITLDGTTVAAHRGGPPNVGHFEWPGPTQRAKLSVGVDSGDVTIAGPYSGLWALFQLFNHAEEWRRNDDGYAVTWQSSGRFLSPSGVKATVGVLDGATASILRKNFFAGTQCPDVIAQ